MSKRKFLLDDHAVTIPMLMLPKGAVAHRATCHHVRGKAAAIPAQAGLRACKKCCPPEAPATSTCKVCGGGDVVSSTGKRHNTTCRWAKPSAKPKKEVTPKAKPAKPPEPKPTLAKPTAPPAPPPF